jgi:hypothetical protein
MSGKKISKIGCQAKARPMIPSKFSFLKKYRNKDRLDTTVQWVVRYRVPFPGTWVVLINPVEKLEERLHKLIYHIPNQTNQNFLIKLILVVITMFIIAFTIIKRMNDALHKTRKPLTP